MTEKTRKWWMLSPSAAARLRSDRKGQKVVDAVTIGCGKPCGDIKDQKVVAAVTIGCGKASR